MSLVMQHYAASALCTNYNQNHLFANYIICEYLLSKGSATFIYKNCLREAETSFTARVYFKLA